MRRLAYLFSDSDDDDVTIRNLDSKAANENLKKYLVKVDNHLNVEKALIDDWHNK
jgi:hypothetical protein